MEKEMAKDIEREAGKNEEENKDTIKKKRSPVISVIYVLIIIAVSLVVLNQYQISLAYSTIGATGLVTGLSNPASNASVSQEEKDLSKVDFSELKSTSHTIAALFPLENAETAQEIMEIIIPTGTPEYGEEMGVSYDDPVGSLNFMARQLWPEMKKLKTEDPDVWKRYVDLASMPVGISCEYCCGITSVGIKPDGESACGCQHNPALLSVTVWLMKNRPDYSDAEILKEVMKWKALFFPKKMTELAIQVAGKDPSSLGELPGMVGGC